MNTQQAKAIPISQILSKMGFEPHHIVKGEKWYLSPFRSETEPSFKLTANEKGFYDHGRGAGGNLLDFVMLYFNFSTVSEALAKLDSLEGWQPVSRAAKQREVLSEKDLDPPISISKIQQLQNRALIQYLQSRGIDPEIARPYVQEIYYTYSYRKYFALAFPNRSGGYELRNPYFKGAVGTKDITLANLTERGAVQTLLVFEGFMDALSALTHFKVRIFPHPALVLNSVAMRDRALETIRSSGATKIYLYLDNDPAGRDLTLYFQQKLAGVNVIDQSQLYKNYKDFNDMVEQCRRKELI
jgi:DNA primase